MIGRKKRARTFPGLQVMRIAKIADPKLFFRIGVVFIDGIPIESATLDAGASGLKSEDPAVDPAALKELDPRAVRRSLLPLVRRYALALMLFVGGTAFRQVRRRWFRWH
jgi:hypothetical protein